MALALAEITSAWWPHGNCATTCCTKVPFVVANRSPSRFGARCAGICEEDPRAAKGFGRDDCPSSTSPFRSLRAKLLRDLDRAEIEQKVLRRQSARLATPDTGLSQIPVVRSMGFRLGFDDQPHLVQRVDLCVEFPFLF